MADFGNSTRIYNKISFNRSVLCCLFAVFLVCVVVAAVSRAGEDSSGTKRLDKRAVASTELAAKHVLMLNSYHVGYKWCDDVVKGVQEVLTHSGIPVTVNYEFMDTKRKYDDEHYKNLRVIYAHKYKNTKFDLIISSDDNALNFLEKYRDELFPGTPIVFCGIKNLQSQKLQIVNATGVNARMELAPTISDILTINPETKKLYVIVDKSPTGQKLKKESQNYLVNKKYIKVIEYLDNHTEQEIRDILSRSEPNSAAIFLTFFTDKNGKSFDPDRVIKELTSDSRIPVYGIVEFNLGQGIVGGHLVGGKYQGRMAAKLGVRILNGEKADDIPPIIENTSQPMFDYRIMKKFGIKVEMLPGNSTVINHPRTWWEEHLYHALAIVGVFIGLLIVIVIMGVNIRSRKFIEQKLRKNSETLEDMVSERTREMQELNNNLIREVAEKITAENQLREREQRLNVTINSIGDGIITVNSSGMIVRMNPAAEEFTGWTLAEAIEKHLDHIFTIVDEITRESAESPFSIVRRTNDSTGTTSRIVLRPRRGKERYISYNASPIRLCDGFDADSVVVVFHDVTKERITQRRLQGQSFIIEQSPSIVVITDIDGNIEYVNPKFTEVTGYSSQDVMGENPRLLKSGETPPETYKKLWDTITSGGKWQGEFHNKRKDGSLYWESASISAIRDENGKVINFVAIKEDITSRKEYEAQIEDIAKFSDQNPNAVIRFLADGTLTYNNPASRDMLGIFELDEFRKPNDAWLTMIKDSLMHGLPSNVECEWEGQHYSITITPIKEYNYVNAYAMEITDRVLAEEALTSSNNALVDLNRKLQSNQQQLVQSEKLASIGQLAAGVAHEINNPVGFVMSNVGTLASYVELFKKIELMLEEICASEEAGDRKRVSEISAEFSQFKEDEDLDFILDDIDILITESRDGAQRVKDIVQNLKSFARVDEAAVKSANINEGIESTLKVVWNELKYKCRVHKELRPIPEIVCYPGQLNQVFMNLLVNAAQAIDSNGDIWIETGRDEENIIISVADNGSGILDKDIPKLFDPFFTTKAVGKGTGLGLSISHGIIEKHGGRIDVQSERGKGTRFTIYLPIASKLKSDEG